MFFNWELVFTFHTFTGSFETKQIGLRFFGKQFTFQLKMPQTDFCIQKIANVPLLTKLTLLVILKSLKCTRDRKSGFGNAFGLKISSYHIIFLSSKN